MFKYIILIDWGASHLKAYLCSVQSETLVLQERFVGPGVSKIDGSFEKTLMSCIDPWVQTYGKLPIILSGHIGSSLGWKDADYLSCPIEPGKIKEHCLLFDCRGHKIRIVPGLMCLNEDKTADVMRGEELQILGWLKERESNRYGKHLLCLPGTHTKWVIVNDGRVQRFKTAMTGELFDLLCRGSMLVQHDPPEFNFDTFSKGVIASSQNNNNLAYSLFGVRTKQIFDEISPLDGRAYLSGLLVGNDVQGAVSDESFEFAQAGNVSIIGAPVLSECFSRALEYYGLQSELYDVEKISLLGFASMR